MRAILRAGSLALALVAAVPAVAAAQSGQAASAGPRFAYINSQVILAGAPGRAEAEAQFEKDMATYRQQVQRMGDSLNTMIAAYEKDEVTLSPPAKETRQKAIREKEAQYQSRVQELQRQAQQREAELVQPIMDQIKRLLDEIRQEGGYAFIFDVGNAGGTIVAADRNLDLTERVLTRLKSMPPVAAKPAAGPATSRPAAVPATSRPAGGPVAAPSGVSTKKPPRD